MNGESLTSVANRLGVMPAYRDVFGEEHTAGRDALVAVTGALVGRRGTGEAEVVDAARGLLGEFDARLIPPVIVNWVPNDVVIPVRSGVNEGDRVEVNVRLDERCRGVGFTEWSWRGRVTAGDTSPVVRFAPSALPVGRHQVTLDVGTRHGEATLLVAPGRLAPLPDTGHLWGVFAPVWSVWGPSRPDATVTSLDEVGRWVHTHGAGLVGTLPLLTTFLDAPYEPSPYSPVSRRHWSEVLVDLDEVTEQFGWGDVGSSRAAPINARQPLRWDAGAQWVRLRPLLAEVSRRVDDVDALRNRLEVFLGSRPEVVAYSCFRAEVERTGSGWHHWSVTARAGRLEAQPHDLDSRMWACAQWLVHDQVSRLTDGFAGRNQVLYLDLAIGTHAEGFDTWVDQDLFAWGATVGAPPDVNFTRGQNWGFPPVRPHAASLRGHEEFAAALATHLEVSGVLRLDHVMGLQRLFWVPDGMDAVDGVYVKQPMEELLAVVCIEAAAHGAAIVGEDLGTVDPGITEAMECHGLYGMYVGQFEVPQRAAEGLGVPGAMTVAALNTHDTPTFAGWAGATDVTERELAGGLDQLSADALRRVRGDQVVALAPLLGSTEPGARGAGEQLGVHAHPHPLLGAFLEWLASSEAAAVLVSLDDLAGSSEPQNVPGTPASRPNWVARLPLSFPALMVDPVVEEILARVGAARTSAPGLAVATGKEP